MTDYISLPRGAKRVPKKHIVNHRPGLTKSKPKVVPHVHNHAVMDTWGAAMADVRAHGIDPVADDKGQWIPGG